MSISNLPTGYKDAVWDGLKRYRLINNSDGTISLEDVTEYSYREESYFGAKDVNQMNRTINSLISFINSGGGNGGNGKIVSLVSFEYLSPSGKYLGDVNEDGVIDNIDLVEVSRYVDGLSSTISDAADINGDGIVTEEDLTLISSFITSGMDKEKHMILRITETYIDNTTYTYYGYADKPLTGNSSGTGGNGVGISSIVYKRTDSNGGNVYTVRLTDNSSYEITAPKGAKGNTGAKGADGYSPVRGTDYWTASDIAQIKSYVDDAILGGAW